MDRAEDITKVTGYSNQPETELYENGVCVPFLSINNKPGTYKKSFRLSSEAPMQMAGLEPAPS